MAQIECSRLITEIADGSFMVSNQTTLAEWINDWLSIGAPGKKRKGVGRKTLERYGQLLRAHVIPALGARPLQKLQSTEIDALYTQLSEKISARTDHHIHNAFGSCLRTAVRTRKLSRNPMSDVIKVPSPREADHGIALAPNQLRALIQGFRGSTYCFRLARVREPTLASMKPYCLTLACPSRSPPDVGTIRSVLLRS
jgi:hypothetical protein